MPDVRVVVVDGVEDPRVAEYRDIGDHDRLVAQGLFVAEGRLVVERLIDDRFQLRSLLLNRAAFEALGPAWRATPVSGGRRPLSSAPPRLRSADRLPHPSRLSRAGRTAGPAPSG
jgi:hypothetical protein